MATYQSPGVYIEEISAGPRPIQASGTTSTGFVGVLELPGTFRRGINVYGEEAKGYTDVLVPLPDDRSIGGVFRSWSMAAAFYPLAWARYKALQDELEEKAKEAEKAKKANKALPADFQDPTTAGPVLTAIAPASRAAKAVLALSEKRRARAKAQGGAQADVDKAESEVQEATTKLTAAKTELDTAITGFAAATKEWKGTPTAEECKTAATAVQTAVAAYIADTGKNTDPTKPEYLVDVGPVTKARDAVTVHENRLKKLTNPVWNEAKASLGDFIDDFLPGYQLQAPAPKGDNTQLVLSEGNAPPLLLDRDANLMNLVKDKNVPTKWEGSLAAYDNPTALVHSLATLGIRSKLAYKGDIPGLGTDALTMTDKLFEKVQDELADPALMVTSMDGYHTWRKEYGRRLFIQLVLAARNLQPREAADAWVQLADDAKEAWDKWLRSQTGLRLLEVSLSGFFANGGTTAYVGLAIAPESMDIADKSSLLKKWFDAVGDTAILVAPGLNKSWQSAILDYARLPAPAGRGDLFAILDTPRYLLTEPPLGVEASDTDRWITQWDYADKSAPAYEVPVPELLATREVPSLRYNPNDTEMDSAVPRDGAGFGAAYGPWFIVRNPLATSPQDAFMVAPPAGFIAGGFAANDNRFGVHKVPANQPVGAIEDLVAHVTAVEQGPINVKGINLIRRRPGGLLIWGGRTTSTDPLWRYVNFRRVFLFIERSVRDAVQWAVFLPNNDTTRSDLRSTIANFLYAQWQQGVLDGAGQKDAYFVQCDEKNNPMETRKNGYLNVDVGIQPPYPAEFVVLKFRQLA